MNFNLTDEQAMLKDSIERFMRDKYTFARRCENVTLKTGFNPVIWSKFSELGWLAIPFDESHGGFGGNTIDIIVVMEAFGKALVAEPYVSTALLFGGILKHCNNMTLQNVYIGRIIDGSLQGAVAYLERQSRFELADTKTKATQSNSGFTLNGEKTVVYNGATADRFIVTARTSGEQWDEQGISLFIIDADTTGLERTIFRMMDGQVVCNLKLDNVFVTDEQLVGKLDHGYDLLKKVVNEVTVALCAEALGAMQHLTNTTVEYAKAREQFGVAIGTFQVLQHRMVDMFVACEKSRSLLYRAACSLEESGQEMQKNIHALKKYIGDAGKLIGNQAIQLHGGMGMTDDLDVGHYVKRLLMINSAFGDADYHQEKFAALAYA